MQITMKRIFPLVFLVFATAFSFGQTHRIDSLKNRLGSLKNPHGKLKAILALCDEYETLPKDTLWNYATKARAVAQNLHDVHSAGLAVYAQAQAYLRWKNTDSAKMLVQRELPEYSVEDAASRDVYFKLAQLKIDFTGNTSNYKDAIAEVYNVMRDAEKYNEPVIMAESMNTLSAFNYDMDFLPAARSWAYKGLALTSGDPRFYKVTAALNLNLAQCYWWIGKQDSAVYCINRSIALSKRIENLYYLSTALRVKASILIEKKEYAGAEKAITESISIIGKVDGNMSPQDKLMVLASIYEHQSQFDKAIKVLQDGLAQDSTYKQVSPHAGNTVNTGGLQKLFYYKELAKCYQLKGDSKHYEEFLEKVVDGEEAFYKANSAQAIAELETKYQFEKKEATIAQQQLALVQKNYLFYGSVLVTLLLGAIGWLIYKELRRKQKLRLQQLQDEEKRLSAKAVADAEEQERKRIAADLHDNLGAQLSYIKRNVNFMMDRPTALSYEEGKKYLTNVNDIAQNAMIDLRETIWVLNKDEVSIQEFADKLKSYLRQQLAGKEVIAWDFQENLHGNWKLSSGEVMHIFRIVQEVVSNIIKHSGANRIDIKLVSKRDRAYTLEITDNGVGFDVNNKYDGHYGLENIERRSKDISASLVIESAGNQGTRIVLIKE
jgi:signal transduction histidine kinase